MKDFPVLGVLPSSNENTFSPNPSLITEIDSLLEHSTGLEVHLERQHELDRADRLWGFQRFHTRIWTKRPVLGRTLMGLHETCSPKLAPLFWWMFTFVMTYICLVMSFLVQIHYLFYQNTWYNVWSLVFCFFICSNCSIHHCGEDKILDLFLVHTIRIWPMSNSPILVEKGSAMLAPRVTYCATTRWFTFILFGLNFLSLPNLK